MRKNDSWPKANSLQKVESGHSVVHWCSDMVCQRIWASRIYHHLYSRELSMTSFSWRPQSKKQYQWSNQWDCRSQFWRWDLCFSSTQDPSENTLVYGSTDKFALAMFNHSAPTLLAYGGSYTNNVEMKDEIFCHLHFLLILEAQRWNEGWKSPLNFAFRCTCNFCCNNLWKSLPS